MDMNASLSTLKKIGILPVTLVLVLLVGTVMFAESFQALLLAAVFLLFLIAASRLRFSNLVLVFLIASGFISLLKRAIFLLGPQSQSVYYGVQIVPTAILVLVLVEVFHRVSWGRLPTSAKILLAYIGIALLGTLVVPSGLPLMVRLMGVQQQLLPFSLFFVGITLSLKQFARIGKAIMILATLSVIYGLLQFFGGPTPIDHAWATETHNYSIHAGKVFEYIRGSSSEFRIYSYYGDPTDWGFALLAGLIGGLVARKIRLISTSCWWLIVIFLLIGLSLTQTRNPWLALLAGLFGCVCLEWSLFRRPWFILGLLLVAFAVVIMGGTLVYNRIFLARILPSSGNPILSRYLTLGTLYARIKEWEFFKQAISIRWPIGKGYGFSKYYANRLMDVEFDASVQHRHSFPTILVTYTGLPGLFLFLAFYLQWLKEGFHALNILQRKNLRGIVKVLIAFSLGFVLSGYFNGICFMTYEFFLLLGIGARAFNLRLGYLKTSKMENVDEPGYGRTMAYNYY